MKRYVVQVLLGLVMALLTFQLGHMANGAWIDCLIPGMLLAIAATGNVHAWPVWMAAFGNFIFYFVLSWLVAAMWMRFGHKPR